jgi:NAD-dependent dihydropyrimidine dehydrogenase PreA subunit
MKYLRNVASLAYDPAKCNGCGRCTEVCPHGVFMMREKKAAVTDRDLCMECGACARNCRSGAIGVNAGVGCAAALIGSMITGGEPVCGCGGTEGASPSCC